MPSKYLPSKQFVRVILITILVGAGLFLVGKFAGAKTVWQNKDTKNSVAVSGQEGDYFTKDSDGDGLYDWEEALWNTDPRITDTDGDGLNDKDEVEEKRKTMDVDATYKSDNDNDTEVFAKQLYATAAVLDKNGGIDKGTLEEFSNSLDVSLKNFNIQNKYTLSDLNLGSITAEDYVNNFITLSDSLSNLEISELGVISRLMEKPGDPLALEDLGKINVSYESFQEGMLKMTVPYKNAGLHLSILNNLYKINTVVQEAKNIEKDPLKFSTYFSKYQEYSNSLDKDIESFSKYIDQDVIIN